MRATSSAVWAFAVLVVGAVVDRPDARASETPPNANAPANFVITEKVLRPREKVPPLGANDWGGCGSVQWVANNFVHNAGNEPVYWRNLHRARDCGSNWFEIDGPGTTWYDLWANGFLSGADLRIYRLVDKQGQPLPAKGDYLNVEKANHVRLVGKATIIPEGTPGFPDGGWIANTYCTPFPNAWIRHGNLRVTDSSGVENGKTYWYAVVAVGPDNQESDKSDEVRTMPTAGADTPPHILIAGNDDKLPALKAGSGFEFTPKLFGGSGPYRWEVLDMLPEGLKLDWATGRISGSPKAAVEEFEFRLKVTDAKGRSDTRAYSLHATSPSKPDGQRAKPAAKGRKPAPPQRITAVAGDGCVTLSWKASPSPEVVGYRLMRSTAPAAKQEQRVYLSPGAPRLEKWDYVVLEKRFSRFDMKYVNPRVRGIGNPMDSPNWHWNGDLRQLSFSIVPHPQPLPAEMIDPGETCLQVKAAPGEHRISQTVFIGTEHGGESIWYGQLEPGEKYRLEVWLRQEGLGSDGRIAFSYGNGYPDIKHSFQVTGDWQQARLRLRRA